MTTRALCLLSSILLLSAAECFAAPAAGPKFLDIGFDPLENITKHGARFWPFQPVQPFLLDGGLESKIIRGRLDAPRSCPARLAVIGTQELVRRFGFPDCMFLGRELDHNMSTNQHSFPTHLIEYIKRRQREAGVAPRPEDADTVFIDMSCYNVEVYRKYKLKAWNATHRVQEYLWPHTAFHGKSVVTAFSTPDVAPCYKAYKTKSPFTLIRSDSNQRCTGIPHHHLGTVSYLTVPKYTQGRVLLRPLYERSHVLGMIAKCSLDRPGAGNRYRYKLVQSLQHKPDVMLHCKYTNDTARWTNRTTDTDLVSVDPASNVSESHSFSLPYNQYREEVLARSFFCPILPGDTPSSRRLSDAILSGCIPVFLGPLWANFPLAEIGLDYSKFSYLFMVEELAYISDQNIANRYIRPPQDWVPQIVRVKNVTDVYDFLKTELMENRRGVQTKLDYLGRAQQFMDYGPQGKLLDVLYDFMCAQTQRIERLRLRRKRGKPKLG